MTDLQIDAVKPDCRVAWLEPQGNSIVEVRNGFKHRGVETTLIVKLEVGASGQVCDLLGSLVIECSTGSFQLIVR